MSIVKKINEILNETDKKKITPQEALSYINRLQRRGWQKRRFEDPEWVHQAEYYLLKRVKLKDIKIPGAEHPPIVKKYAMSKGELPPIFLDYRMMVIDGIHRLNAAKLRDDKDIMAYVASGNINIL